MIFKRRNLLRFATAFGAGAAIYPFFSYLYFSKDSKASVEVSTTVVKNLADFPANSSRRITFNGRVVIIIRCPDGKFIALEGTCSHMGCLLNYDRDQQNIFCPCHRGVYDLAGKVLEGPPPAGLKLYTIEGKNNSLVLYA